LHSRRDGPRPRRPPSRTEEGKRAAETAARCDDPPIPQPDAAMAYNVLTGRAGRVMRRTRRRRDAGGRGSMDRRGRIRLSTMEIVLIATLLGMLVLSLLQALQQERLLQGEHDLDDDQ